MLFVSLLLWVAGYFFHVGSGTAFLDSIGLNFIGELLSRLFSLLAYVCVALVLNHLYLFEQRVPYLPHIFLWLVSVHLFLQPDYLVATASLFFLLSVAQLLSCCQESGQERAIYSAFAILSFSSLFLLQFAYLLPLFFVYLWVARIWSFKNLFAALLGVVTPYWFLCALIFVEPSLDVLLLPMKFGVLCITAPAAVNLSLPACVSLVMELLVVVVALSLFFVSSLPAKPLLRRRFLFLIIVNLYLLLLQFVVPQDYSLLLAWRLPGVAVMAAFVFSMRVTRLSNIYFIILNVMWLVTAALCLWMV